MLQLLGDTVPQTTCRGFAPGPHLGTSVPRPPDLVPQLHLLDPPLVHDNKTYSGFWAPRPQARDLARGKTVPLCKCVLMYCLTWHGKPTGGGELLFFWGSTAPTEASAAGWLCCSSVAPMSAHLLLIMQYSLMILCGVKDQWMFTSASEVALSVSTY